MIGDISSQTPELLLTIDLAGFDRVTLTDNVAYNLLDCKQLHVICSGHLKNEQVLEKTLSIAMFFAIATQEKYRELVEGYPHIPWISYMESWNSREEVYSANNVVQIAEILNDVIKECRLS